MSKELDGRMNFRHSDEDARVWKYLCDITTAKSHSEVIRRAISILEEIVFLSSAGSRIQVRANPGEALYEIRLGKTVRKDNGLNRRKEFRLGAESLQQLDAIRQMSSLFNETGNSELIRIALGMYSNIVSEVHLGRALFHQNDFGYGEIRVPGFDKRFGTHQFRVKDQQVESNEPKFDLKASITRLSGGLRELSQNVNNTVIADSSMSPSKKQRLSNYLSAVFDDDYFLCDSKHEFSDLFIASQITRNWFSWIGGIDFFVESGAFSELVLLIIKYRRKYINKISSFNSVIKVNEHADELNDNYKHVMEDLLNVRPLTPVDDIDWFKLKFKRYQSIHSRVCFCMLHDIQAELQSHGFYTRWGSEIEELLNSINESSDSVEVVTYVIRLLIRLPYNSIRSSKALFDVSKRQKRLPAVYANQDIVAISREQVVRDLVIEEILKGLFEKNRIATIRFAVFDRYSAKPLESWQGGSSVLELNSLVKKYVVKVLAHADKMVQESKAYVLDDNDKQMCMAVVPSKRRVFCVSVNGPESTMKVDEMLEAISYQPSHDFALSSSMKREY